MPHAQRKSHRCGAWAWPDLVGGLGRRQGHVLGLLAGQKLLHALANGLGSLGARQLSHFLQLRFAHVQHAVPVTG